MLGCGQPAAGRWAVAAMAAVTLRWARRRGSYDTGVRRADRSCTADGRESRG